MANNEENSLIGYDPLAWMEQEQSDVAEPSDDILAATGLMASQDTEDSDIDPELVAENSSEPDEEAAMIDDTTEQQQTEDEISAESPVLLEPLQNIQNVGRLHQRLKKVLAANDLIEINASEVNSIDTTTLQLLVALKKDVSKLDKILLFDSPSPRFYESVKLLGLLDVLDIK